MRILKLLLAGVVLIFLAIVVTQNSSVFLEEKYLRLNLFFWNDESPPIPLAVYFLSCFLIGFLSSYFGSLTHRFRTKRIMASQMEMIHKLEDEVRFLKREPVYEPDAAGTPDPASDPAGIFQ